MNRILYQEPTLIISVQSPGPRTIQVDGKRHFLHFPYLTFVASQLLTRNALNRDYIFFAFASQKPPRYATDEISRIPLPNTYGNGRICLGSAIPTFNHIASFHKWAINRFFNSEFAENELQEKTWYGDEADRWRKAKDYKKVNFSPTKPLALWLKGHNIELIVHDFYHEMIEKKAYYLWLDAGQPHGQHDHFWQRAEQEITWTFQN